MKNVENHSTFVEGFWTEFYAHGRFIQYSMSEPEKTNLNPNVNGETEKTNICHNIKGGAENHLPILL